MPITLEGKTLGEKHKDFNKLVQDSITNKQFNLTKISNDDDDIENLFKIHTASKIKNVEYIIEVFKCTDLLYISTAIKQSTWLITEQKYAHIINPEYLHKELFPYMLTKAINKLLLHIRLNLKDENRYEIFYNYLKDLNKDTDKWLINCSILFIENIIQNERYISFQTYKRLCKRSVRFLQYYTKVKGRINRNTLQGVVFLLKSNTEEFLNTIPEHSLPALGKRYTEIVMKQCPNRILNNLEKYIHSIDFSVLAKYLKIEDIKDFLIKHMNNNKTKPYFSNFEDLKHFIKKMPSEIRFEFVKQTYIDKSQNTFESIESVCSESATDNIHSNTYRWYQYAPFNVAFGEIKKLIRTENSPSKRCAIMCILITCARKSPQDIKVLLQYYYDQHRNEPFKFKIQLINKLISQIPTHKFDSETWDILDKLFQTLEVYIDSDRNNNEVQLCLKSIIMYKVLHDEIISDVIEKKLQFNTFKNSQHTLNSKEQNKMFHYLLTFILTKIKDKNIKYETDLDDVVALISDALNLLNVWNIDIKKYTLIIDKIRELTKIKTKNSWEIELSSLYNANKTCRRHLFEESIMLQPGQEVCFNALKHDPELLSRYSEIVDALRADDAVSLRHLLTKLRVYWPRSLTSMWTKAYLKQLNNKTGSKATTTGLFTLLPQKQLLEIAKKYVPEESKINWNEIDPIEFNFRKNIAKYLYIARPLVSLDTVLWYAKGDYLQFVVPSLDAISYNMSRRQSRAYISKLLNAPISLQKHGLHLAYKKLPYDELTPIFSDVWQATSNATIRTLIFSCTYNLLCGINDPFVAAELWQTLKMFIDDMALDENKVVFNKLSSAEKIPTYVQGQFYMRSYQFLTSLPPAANCDTYINTLINYTPNIIDLLDSDFVADKLLSPIKEHILKERSKFIEIVSSYVLLGKTEEEQCDRFRKVLAPALEHAFLSWNTVVDDEYIFKQNVDSLLQALTWGFTKFLCLKKNIVPVKLFTAIKMLMEQKLSIEDNYLRYTSWVLTCEYVKLVAENKSVFCDANLDNILLSDFEHYWLPDDAEPVWRELHMKISRKLGPIIVKILKEHTERYFSSIWWLFSGALNRFFIYLVFPHFLMIMETLKYMVMNEDFIPSYLVVCEEMPTHEGDDEVIKKQMEIHKILLAHPSLEVQMHYHRAFGGIVDPVS